MAYMNVYLSSIYNELTRKKSLFDIIMNLFGHNKPVTSRYWKEVIREELDYW